MAWQESGNGYYLARYAYIAEFLYKVYSQPLLVGPKIVSEKFVSYNNNSFESL